MPYMHFAGLTAYAASCWLLNNVLQYHYFRMCRGTVFALFFVGQSGYCAFVDNCLFALQWSPVLVATPILLKKLRDSPFPPQE